jgi:DNA polymerase-3 subunit delta'
MNWHLLGHEWAVELLQGQLGRGQLRQAYLITGPEGIGRRTFALRLAQTLNCPNPPQPGVPCLTCHTCQQIERMQHPDLSIVQAEEIGGTLKVDQIRELQRSLALAPYAAPYRIALLLRFEEAHPSAANALLKTLEEPPPSVVLILTADSAENLLETIVSRCETVRLRPLPIALVEQGLQTHWGLEPKQARLLAHLSNGRPGYALRLNTDETFLDKRAAWLDAQIGLLEAGRIERFNYAETASKDRSQLRQMLEIWLVYWRDVLLAASGAKVPLTNLDRAAEIQKVAAQVGLQSAQKMVKEIEDLQTALAGNANPRLTLEILLLDLPQFA